MLTTCSVLAKSLQPVRTCGHQYGEVAALRLSIVFGKSELDAASVATRCPRAHA
ncbi:MAG TPA: hypothetical protein VHT93_15225 [Pseudolabrys sp.]|nr:hypothetical protein [Pseudolabrys sp.]